MEQLVFATHNQHKLEEVKKILVGSSFQIISLDDIGCKEDIPETAETLEGNATQKARYIYEKYGYNCFADDTGLEVEALGMEPGVYSARYAGEGKDARANMQKLLLALDKIKNRTARFRTVVSLIIDGKEHLFEGVVNGVVLEREQGKKGFGYDPVFMPNGYEQSFAEMDINEKNKISHRGRAIARLVNFLNNF